MKVVTRSLFVMLVGLPLTAHLSPLTAQASATLYNDGRVLVRRTLPLSLPRGASAQRINLGQFDVGSLFSLDPDVSILGVRDDGANDDGALLRRAIGRSLLFRSGAMYRDTMSATLVSVAPLRVRLADGSIISGLPGTPSFPAEAGFLAPATEVTFRSDAVRKDVRLGYFAPGGGGWQASYQAVFSGGQARLSGVAVMNPGQLALDSAEIQLLAGQVSQVGPVDRVMSKAMNAAPAMAEALQRDQVGQEQKVGEFHLYTLPGRVTLSPGVTTTAALFDPASASYEKTYTVEGALPYWGGFGEDNNAADVPVGVTYVVKRPRKTELGDRPLPAGVVRMFEPDSGGRLQLIGEAAIDHSPAGEDLRLNAGTAFDLTAKRVQMSWQTGRDSTQGRRYLRTYAIAAYADTLRNAGSADVTVDVFEERGGEWTVLLSSVPAEKVSSTRTRFRVKVPAGGQALLTYKVRVVW